MSCRHAPAAAVVGAAAVLAGRSLMGQVVFDSELAQAFFDSQVERVALDALGVGCADGQVDCDGSSVGYKRQDGNLDYVADPVGGDIVCGDNHAGWVTSRASLFIAGGVCALVPGVSPFGGGGPAAGTWPVSRCVVADQCGDGGGSN